MKKLIIVLFIASLLTTLVTVVPVSAKGGKDVLVVGMAASDLISLDPARAFEFTGTGIDAQMYDRLLEFPSGRCDRPELSLAESYTVSDDGRIWTFKLREGVKFHSGNEVTARDVVYSFTRVIELKDQPSFILTQFELRPDSIKALDKYTVRITLDKKYAKGIFFACLSAIVAGIVDSETVRQHVAKTDKYPDGDYGATWLSRNSAGSGPFKLVKWEKNDRVILDAFPDHFRNPPKVKRVIIKEINEATSRRLQVEKGDIDVAWILLPDQIEAMTDNQAVHILGVPATPVYYLGMNVSKGALKNEKVRSAIRWAIDYDGLIDNIMGGEAVAAGTFIPAGFAGHSDKIMYQTDLEKAGSLMKEAGYENGTEITMDHGDQTPFPELAQAIQHSLSQIGIKVRLNKLISAQLWPKYRAQKHEMILARWGATYIDPHSNAQPFSDYKAKQLCWRNMYYHDPASELIQRAAEEMDEEKRMAIYNEVNEIIQEKGPYAFLFQPVYNHAIRSNIKNFYPAPSFHLWKLYSVEKE